MRLPGMRHLTCLGNKDADGRGQLKKDIHCAPILAGRHLNNEWKSSNGKELLRSGGMPAGQSCMHSNTGQPALLQLS